MITSNEIRKLQIELNELKSQTQPACSAAMQKQRQQKSKKNKHKLKTSKIFEMARNQTNPFELLGSASTNNFKNNNNKKLNIFLNRSAIKLSNINSLVNHTLLLSKQKEDDVFVDLCGAPGGFSEYALHALIASNNNYDSIYGFGMSLQKNKDGDIIPWKMQDSIPNMQSKANNKTKIKYKICNGADKTGDMNNWSNMLSSRNEVLSTTNNKLAQLIVADGGANEQRNSNKQEEIAIPLILSQISAASILLQVNGNFVLKLFTCQTTILRKIMQFLIKSFEKNMIVKPISSRPASLERYIVCYGYKHHTTTTTNENDRNSRSVDYVLAWRNKMLQLCNNAILQQTHNKEDDELVEALLSNYLNYIDYNILKLNMQVCREILLYLEEQCTNHKKKTMNNNNSVCHNSSSFINMHLHRKAWRII